jgi:hypothetical protein
MDRVLLAGLMRLDLPTRPVMLCDGGFVVWGADVFAAVDEEFGAIVAFEGLNEGVGDEAPAGRIVMLPATTAAAAVLSSPGYQNSRMRLWIAEVSENSGRVIGEPDLMADWQLDSTRLRIGRGTRVLEMGCVTRSQRLMARNEGNVLSRRHHQSIFPGETGHDNAVGLTVEVAWGVPAPPRGTVAGGAGGSFGGFGGGILNAISARA